MAKESYCSNRWKKGKLWIYILFLFLSRKYTLLKVTITTNRWAALLVKMRKQTIRPLPAKLTLM